MFVYNLGRTTRILNPQCCIIAQKIRLALAFALSAGSVCQHFVIDALGWVLNFEFECNDLRKVDERGLE